MEPNEQTPPNNNQTDLTPQEIAQNAFQKDSENPDLGAIDKDKLKKPKRFSLKNLTKKQKIILVVVVIALIAGGFSSWWFVLRGKPVTLNNVGEPVEQAPTETPTYSRITGLEVDTEVNERNVTGVMIENSPDARPQSGLRDADIVYEAVAEGGITRFLALFHDTSPKYVGPVRSARPYYLYWALPFDSSLAHVGGSPEALGLIKAYKIRDLDQFHNSGAFERVTSRYAPHNVYTSIDKLDALEKQKGFKPGNYTAFERKTAKEPSGEMTAETINFNISSYLYNVKFNYNKDDNTYTRHQAGKRHLDEKSGKAIVSDVVVALVMTKGIHSDGHHTTYKTTGSGKMFVFQDGQVIKGTWKKSDHDVQFKFLDANDQPIKLNPGKTWITAVGAASQVKYKP